MASPATAVLRDTGAASGSDRADRDTVLIVRIGDWMGAIRIEFVDRVLPAVAIHPAGRALRDVIGHVNVHGTIVPVADTQAILGLRRSIGLTDHFVLTTTAHGPVIIPVEETLGVGVVIDEAVDGGTDEPPALRPVRVELIGEPVVTLIDPDGAVGHIARPSTNAGAV